MIVIQDLDYSVGNSAVLKRFNATIEQGKHTVLLGNSGTGKTTLLHLLAGLLTPSGGTVNVDQQNIAALSESEKDGWRGRNLGMVFQTLHLVKALTVLDNLRLANAMAGQKVDLTFLEGLLANLGLEQKINQFPHELSVGQAQRVAIARAVANKPKWILADEPTSALDDKHCAETLDLLEQQAGTCGATLIIATHDVRVKERFSNRITLQ
jgi:putative ABC transport system ATP-binding protein